MKVKGKRSPRWALMQRFILRGEDGTPYLDRLRIVDTPWFGIYLHHITAPDEQPDPHNHPWPFWSLVLKGGYTEALWERQENAVYDRYRSRKYKTWGRFSLHRMHQKSAHKIIRTYGATTLILRGRRSPREWGFWTPDGFVPVSQYEG